MKKTLSLILAVLMLLGCMSVTAFAEETDNSTDITLTVAKSLTYDMVIPEDVTNLNAAGIYAVGQAKVENVKNATEKTVISYTAETTAFKSEGKTDIPASYYTEQAATNAFPTDAVTVYENKADAENIPTMYVGISTDAWDAAENGTYTATVTFNFSAEEKEAKPVTAADALEVGAEFTVNSKLYSNHISVTMKRTAEGFSCESAKYNGNDSSTLRNSATASVDGTVITFHYVYGSYTVDMTINTASNAYTRTDSATVITYESFAIKPAGATEFTEITLTKAESQPAPTPTPVTVADLFATVEGGFPTSGDEATVPFGAWSTEEGKKCYCSGDVLVFRSTSESLQTYAISSEEVEKSGSDFVYVNDDDSTITFKMEDDVLTGIAITGTTDWNGEYTKQAVTIADILPDGFPEEWELSSWKNENESFLYATSGVLYADYPGATISVSLDTELTTTNSIEYICEIPDTDIVWVFEMNGEKFSSVSINSETLEDDYAYLVGIYSEMA